MVNAARASSHFGEVDGSVGYESRFGVVVVQEPLRAKELGRACSRGCLISD